MVSPQILKKNKDFEIQHHPHIFHLTFHRNGNSKVCLNINNYIAETYMIIHGTGGAE